MKKIVYLHQYFCRPTMNGGIRSYEFAKRLASDGYDVHVVTSDREKEFSGWHIEKVDGFTVHWVSVLYNNRLGFLARVWAFIRFSLLSSLKVLQLKADINFATSTPLTIVLPALVAKFLRRTPYVFEVRDLWPEIPIALGFLKGRAAIFFAKKLAGLAYKHASKIVVLSRDMGKGVLIYGDYEKKMVLIPNASDVALLRTEDENAVLSFWQQRNLDSRNASLVVYTGTLGRVNQVGYLVDLAAESCIKQADNIKFVVFGDGAEKETIIKAAKDKKVWNDNFFLFSPVSKKELAYVLGGASLSISLVDNIPILWGNSANKFFDAFAAGVPVGVNHGGWQAEVIQEFSCGLVLDYNVPESAKSLLSFLSDKDRLVQAKVQSARLGDNVYSRDVLYEQLRTVFSEVRV